MKKIPPEAYPGDACPWGVRVLIDDEPDEPVTWEPRSAWALFDDEEPGTKPRHLTEEDAKALAKVENEKCQHSSYFPAPIEPL